MDLLVTCHHSVCNAQIWNCAIYIYIHGFTNQPWPVVCALPFDEQTWGFTKKHVDRSDVCLIRLVGGFNALWFGSIVSGMVRMISILTEAATAGC